MNGELKIQKLKSRIWKLAVFLACFIPLGLLGLDAYTDDLGANPIEFITRSTGSWTLTFLLITLSITPLRKLSGWQWLIKLRRMFGLFAFFYALLHFMTYIWLDQFFDLQSIFKDVFKRPFITAGFMSFTLILPLALTSTSNMIRRLGKRWQQLHRVVYVIAIGGVVHFMWLVKADRRQPMIHGAILALLFVYRLLARQQRSRFALRPAGHGSPARSRALSR